MGYSDKARAFTRIPVVDQVRLEDRVSFLYLEHCQVVQDRTGVWALREGADGHRTPNGPDKERVQIPVGGICVVMLGPGTSVTQPAMTSMANSGATVMFTGGGGVPAYAAAVPRLLLPGGPKLRRACGQTMWPSSTPPVTCT